MPHFGVTTKPTFTWDPKKAASNITAHEGVTFEEAASVFEDQLAMYDGHVNSHLLAESYFFGERVELVLILGNFTRELDDESLVLVEED